MNDDGSKQRRSHNNGDLLQSTAFVIVNSANINIRMTVQNRGGTQQWGFITHNNNGDLLLQSTAFVIVNIAID